ncbi:MAG: AI-2E family transporter [Rubrobacter sp.]
MKPFAAGRECSLPDEKMAGEKVAGTSRTGARPTPIRISKLTRNALVLVALVVVAYVMWAVPSAPIAIIGGFALALVLSFPVRGLSYLMPRGLAIFVSFVFLILLVLVALLVVIPLLAQQLFALARALPSLIDNAEKYGLVGLRLLRDAGFLPGAPREIISTVEQELVSGASGISRNALGGLFGYVTGTFSFVLSIFGVIFVAAYLLVDVRKLKASYLFAIPTRYRRDARDLWDAFGFSLSRYLSGLALICVIQGVLSSTALYLIGVPYALVLGAWVSLTALIPLLGAWLGAVPAVIVAFTQSIPAALLTMLTFLIIQQLEGNFLTPRIQGRVMNVHPIMVFLAVIIGGGLGGILGVLFAVPTLAVLRVIFDFLRPRLRTYPEEEHHGSPQSTEPATEMVGRPAVEGGARDGRDL